MTSAMRNGGEEMRSYVITIPPLWGRGEEDGALKGIYDLDAMRNKLQSMPWGLGLNLINTASVMTTKVFFLLYAKIGIHTRVC